MLERLQSAMKSVKDSKRKYSSDVHNFLTMFIYIYAGGFFGLSDSRCWFSEKSLLSIFSCFLSCFPVCLSRLVVHGVCTHVGMRIFRMCRDRTDSAAVCGGEESIVLYRLWHTTTLFEWSVSLWFQTNSNCAVFVNPNWIPEIFPAASYRHEWPNSLLVHQRRIWALLLNHADTRISHKQIDWQSFTQCSSMKTII